MVTFKSLKVGDTFTTKSGTLFIKFDSSSAMTKVSGRLYKKDPNFEVTKVNSNSSDDLVDNKKAPKINTNEIPTHDFDTCSLLTFLTKLSDLVKLGSSGQFKIISTLEMFKRQRKLPQSFWPI